MSQTTKQRAVTLKRQGFDDSVVGAILGVDPEDVQALLFEADPPVAVIQQQVFEITDYLIPAGSEWLHERFDEATLPGVYLGVINSLYIEIAESLPEDFGLALDGYDNAFLGIDNAVDPLYKWAGTAILSGAGSGLEPLGEQVIYGQLTLQRPPGVPTPEDITVVRARATYLIF